MTRVEKGLSNYTYEDYLTLEASSEEKLEFHGGFIVAMAGGTPEHGLIAINFATAVNKELRRKGKNDCGTLSSDVKIYIPGSNRGFFLDAYIVCGEMERSNTDPQGYYQSYTYTRSSFREYTSARPRN